MHIFISLCSHLFQWNEKFSWQLSNLLGEREGNEKIYYGMIWSWYQNDSWKIISLMQTFWWRDSWCAYKKDLKIYKITFGFTTIWDLQEMFVCIVCTPLSKKDGLWGWMYLFLRHVLFFVCISVKLQNRQNLRWWWW